MLFSIGMIVKNEQKYLRRCLEGLKQILDNVDSELIIVDTGSTDDTVAIANEFTDKVLHFEWCNDFAAARNVSLKFSKGEWFMFIDADEIIEDASEIIEFFNSGEYKKYGVATYIIRNYNNEKQEKYIDYHALRMVKKNSEVIFKGIIHERFTGMRGDKKDLRTVAHHYGYMNVSRRAIEYKAKRNIEGLLNELKTVENPMRTYFHLAQAHCILKEYNKAEEYMLKNIKLIESDQVKDYDKSFDYAIYLQTAKQYETVKKYRQSINMLKKYIEVREKETILDIEAYGSFTINYFELAEYEKTVSSYENYKRVYKMHQAGKLGLDGARFYSVGNIDETDFRLVSYMAVKAYIELKNYAEAERILEEIDLDSFSGAERDLTNYISASFLLMKEINDYRKTDNLINHSNAKIRTTVQAYVTANYKQYPGLLEYLRGKEIIDSKYFQMINVRAKDEKGEDVRELLYLFTDGLVYSNEYSDVAYYLLKNKIPMKEIVKITGFCNIGTDIEEYINKDDEMVDIIYDYINSIEEVESFEEVYFGFVLYDILIKNSEMLSEDKLECLFEEYADFAGSYITMVYSEELLNDEHITAFPANIQFAYCANKVLELCDNNKFNDAIQLLTRAIATDTDKAYIVQFMIKKTKKRIEENITNAENEFNEYVKNIKLSITKLLDSGDLSNAREFIQAYKRVNSADADIVQLEKRLEILANN